MNSTARIQTRTQTAAARKTKNSQGARSEPRVRSARTAKRAVNQTPRARAATTSRAERTAPPVREPKRPDGTILWTIEDAKRKLATDRGYGKRLQSPDVTVKGLRFNMIAFPVGRSSTGGRLQNVLAIYLRATTSDPARRRRFDVDFKFQIDKHNGPHRRRRSPKCGFDLVHHDGHTPAGEYEDGHGFEGLLSYKVLFDPAKGYLVDDTITLRAEFNVLDSTADDIDEPHVGGEENPPNAAAEETEPNVTAEVNQRNEDDDEVIEVKTVKLIPLKVEAVAQEPVETSEQQPEAPAEDEPQSDDDDCVIILKEEAEPSAAVGVTNAAAARIAKQESSGENGPGPDEPSERAQMLEHAPSGLSGHQLAAVPPSPTPSVNTEASEARPWSSCSSIRSLLDDNVDGRHLIAALECDDVPTDVLPIGDEGLDDIFAPCEDVPEMDVGKQLSNRHPEPNNGAVAEPNTAAISVHVAAVTAQQGQLAVNAPGPSVAGAGKVMFLDFILESSDAIGKAYAVALMTGKSATDFLRENREKNVHEKFADFVLEKLREKNENGTKAFMKMLRETGRIEEYAEYAVETSPAMTDYIRAKRLNNFMEKFLSNKRDRL